jgi:hypothetical protein
MRPSRFAVACSFALTLAACEQAAPPRPAAAPPAPPVAAAPAEPATPAGHLRRGEVDQVLVQQGPPWVLRRVMPEEVIRKDGKFTGWRLVGLPDDWRIDLKPGDVVSRVNGLPVETPDEAWEAWKSVAKAPEIRISLTRDGAARELVIPIDGALSPETAKALGRDGAPPRAAGAPAAPKRGSVQLGGSAATEAPPEDESY